MQTNERGSILLEFLIVAVILAGAGAGLLFLLERLYLVRQLEYDAARSALSTLAGRTSRPLLRGCRNSNSTSSRKVVTQTFCQGLEKSVSLQR